MTTQELAELFLTALYDLAEAAPHPNFLFNMNEFVPSAGISDFAELARAVEFLESKGLVYLASFDNMGGISAGITPGGQLFVEKGGETGIIADCRKDPQRFFSGGGGPGPRVPMTDDPIVRDMGSEWMSQANMFQEVPKTQQPDAPASFHSGIDPAVDGLLLAISILVEKDTGLIKADRDDLIRDVETLRIQVQKNRLNKQIIIALLDSLSTMQTLVPLLKHVAAAL